MPKVEIYTTPSCPFCFSVKELLEEKGVPFTEIDVMTAPGLRLEMTERANGNHTVPQVFIDGEHMGGCDELCQLDSKGALDAKLGSDT